MNKMDCLQQTHPPLPSLPLVSPQFASAEPVGGARAPATGPAAASRDSVPEHTSGRFNLFDDEGDLHLDTDMDDADAEASACESAHNLDSTISPAGAPPVCDVSAGTPARSASPLSVPTHATAAAPATEPCRVSTPCGAGVCGTMESASASADSRLSRESRLI